MDQKPEEPVVSSGKGAGVTRANQRNRKKYERELEAWNSKFESLWNESRALSYPEGAPPRQVPVEPSVSRGDIRIRRIVKGRSSTLVTEYLHPDGTWSTEKPEPWLERSSTQGENVSYSNSIYNIPGSPVVASNLQGYATELFSGSYSL